MTRALSAGLIGLGVAGLGAVVLARQTTLPPPNEAGKPTQAKVLVINHDKIEAIPVTVMRDPNDPPTRTSIVGIPTFAIAGTPIVEARRARQQWEYRTVTFTAGQDVAGVLNALGQDGWEVITTPAPAGGAQSALLKRPR